MSIAESTGALLATAEESMLYVFTSITPTSSSSSDGSFHTILKISAMDLMALNDLDKKLQYFHDKKWLSWTSSSSKPALPTSMYANLAVEATLQYDSHTQAWYSISLFMMERHIQLCSSSSNATTIPGDKSNDAMIPIGDAIKWQCSYVADLEDRWYDPNIISYGAKSHPELICPQKQKSSRGFVVSFVSNSIAGPKQLFTDKYRDIYTPKFMYIEAKK